MKKSLKVGFILFVALFTIMLVACSTAVAPSTTSSPSTQPATTTPAKAKMPELIGISTYPSGSVGYVLHAAMGQAITKSTGIPTRVVSGATAKARMTAVIKGEALLGANPLAGVYAPVNGIWEWSADGPQKLYLVWNGEPTYNSLSVRGDSGLRTFAALKGKKASDFTELDPSTQAYMKAMLAFGDLTVADMKSVPEPGYPQGIKDMSDGRLDVTFCSVSSSNAYEAEANIHGIYAFEFPKSDTAGWKRAKAIFSAILPVKVTGGCVGATPEKPKEYTGQPYPIITMANADEDFVYRCVKGIIENYDVYKDANPKAKYWDVTQALNLDALDAYIFPYHPGAVKAFKETGKWTAAHDKWQADRVKLADTIPLEWAKAKTDAAGQGITFGDKKWADYWEGRVQKFIADWISKSS